MTHSHDRTKLAQFGFSDPDKKNPEHELACAYLAQKSVAKRLITKIYPGYQKALDKAAQERERCKPILNQELTDLGKLRDSDYDEAFRELFPKVRPNAKEGSTHTLLMDVHEEDVISTVAEKHITKGVGKFKTSIGWVDVYIEAYIQFVPQIQRVTVSQGRISIEYGGWQPAHDRSVQFSARCGIEVKIATTPISDVIRQLTFYNTYYALHNWIVVTKHDLTDAEKGLLKNAGFLHLKLGADFEDFKSKQSQVSGPSLEI